MFQDTHMVNAEAVKTQAFVQSFEVVSDLTEDLLTLHLKMTVS